MQASSAQVLHFERSVEIGNRILAALPAEELQRLQPHFQTVQLPQGKVLYHPGDIIQDALFLDDGLVALRSTTADGTSTEVLSIGNEGVIGVPLILRSNLNAYETVVQIPVTRATKVKAEVLKTEFDRGGKLYDMMLRYANLMLTQVSQSVICTRFHSSEQRLARSLLVALDTVQSNTINLTHETIAQMLGTRRTSVTMAARVLQREEMIGYSRGRITVLDRQRLEKAACECYRAYQENLDHFLSGL
ncbi:MAG TPA: Crp/Fnr family transcriptional regulator [Pyrinomonadaceae bacterium]|nr:Crp/Fnr family transcriptional regulator [Pyrinomonadaceae bacterium]